MWRAMFLVVLGCHSQHEGAPDSATPRTITVHASNAPAATIAVRADDDAWQVMPGPTLAFAAIDHYDVVVSCPMPSLVEAYSLTVDELQTLEYDRDCAASTAMITGTVPPVTPDTYYGINWGSWTTTLYQGTPQVQYSLSVPPGTRDLVAGVSSFPCLECRYWQDLRIQRDVTVTDTTTVDPYSTGEAISTGSYSLQSNGDPITSSSTLIANGTRFDVSLSLNGGETTQVNESSLAPGDRNLVVASTDTRSVEYVTRTPITNVELPAPPDSAPLISGVTATWVSQPGAVAYRLTFPANPTPWIVHVSAALFDRTQTLGLPDVSGIPGWNVSSPTSAMSVFLETDASLDEILRSRPIGPSVIRTVRFDGG